MVFLMLGATFISAINAKQIQVNFNTAVDGTTVIGTAAALKNISVTKVGSAASTGLTAELSEDEKSLVITAGAGETFSGSYVVNVSDKVLDADGTAFEAFSQIIKAEDKVAPSFVSATATAKTTTKEVVVKFNEPVVADGVTAYVNGGVAVVSAGDELNELKITTATGLKAGDAVAIKLTNVKDFADNYTTPNPIEVSTSVVADVTAPAVVSAAVEGESSVKVTFDKALESTQASTLGSKVRLISSNGTVAGTFENAAVIDGKTATFTLSNPTFNKEGNLTGTFYLDAGVKDKLGNESEGLYSEQLTFVKDTVKPLVAAVEYKDNAINLTYTEKVTVADGTTLTAINKSTGAVSTVTIDTEAGATTGKTTVSADGKTVTIENHGLADGNYELRLPAATVSDLADVPNTSAYFTTTLVVKATVVSEDDTQKPTVTFTEDASGFTTASEVGSEYQFSFDLADNVGINFDSVLNVSNYTYDGKALPANSYVTTNATSATDKDVTVTVHVPSSSVPTTVTAGLFSVVNVKDASGNSLANVATTKVTLEDGVAPELSSAAISSGDKAVLVVGLSEAVSNLDAAGDFVLKVDGQVVAVSGVTPQTAGTDKGKYYVTGTGISDFTAATTLTLELAEDTADTVVADIAGNDAVFGEAIKIK